MTDAEPARTQATGGQLQLGGDAQQLWDNDTARAAALEAIMVAWDRKDPQALAQAALRVDHAVQRGLRAAGLPRMPGVQVEVAEFNRGWIGRASPTGVLQLDVAQLRYYLVAERQPNRIWHTWVHESLHARQPRAAALQGEGDGWRGYEEGMVDGLARLVAWGTLSPAFIDSAYGHYVHAYCLIAGAVGIGGEELWRQLWRLAPGRVRAEFPTTVARLWAERTGTHPNDAALRRLRGVGDAAFASERHTLDEALFGQFLRMAFR